MNVATLLSPEVTKESSATPTAINMHRTIGVKSRELAG
jgi:hypothetical protein